MDENDELLKIKSDETKLEQRIQNGKLASNEIANRLIDQSTEITTRINTGSEEIGRQISETTELTIGYANAIRNYFIPRLTSIVDSLGFYLWIVISLFIITGVFGAILLGYIFPDSLIIFLPIWPIIALYTLYRIQQQNKKIRGYSEIINNSVDALATELTKKHSSIRLMKTDFSLFDRLVSTLNNAGAEVASAALDIIPLTSKFLDHQNKRLQRDQFLQNFRNAMSRYGFQVNDPSLNSKLRTKLWLSENEEKYLVDSILIMTKIYSEIDQSIFRLLYYEFLSSTQLEQQWKLVKADESLRKQLARILILNKVILEGKLDEKSIPALSKLLERIPLFSFTEVDSKTSEFFNKLSEFKISSLVQVSAFGFQVVTLKDSFLQYVPESPDSSSWQDDVLTFLANNILHEDSDVIKLIVKDGLGDSNRTASWKRIITEKKFEKLAIVLIKTRIHKQFSDFDDNIFLAHTILCINALAEKDFSISEIAIKVLELENKIVRTKRLVINCAKFFRIESKDLYEVIKCFNPTDVTKAETEFVEKCASIYNIETPLFTFLYKIQNNSVMPEDDYRSFINANGSLLSTFLISRLFVPGGEFSENIELLLREQSTFDLSSFMQLASEYENLFSSVKSLESFLDFHEIFNGNSINFTRVLELCPVNFNESFEEELVMLSTQMIRTNYEQQLDDVNLKHLFTAVVLLFLKQQNDDRFRVLCQKLYYMDFGSRVLYLHLYQSEAKISGKTPRLKEAIVQAGKLAHDNILFNYLEFFKLLLLDGKLPDNASSMIEVRIDSLRNDIKVAQENGLEKNIFQNYVKPISDLLNDRINEDIVKDFLTTKALSAYLVTVPKNYKGIGFITSQYKKAIKKAAQKLAETTNDTSYLTLFQVQKGTGKSTRIGLVPFGMSFEEFSQKFEALMNEALLEANQKQTVYPYPLPYYLVRIFPSEDALREIMKRDDVKTSPFEIISEMVKDRAGFDESIPLLSLLQKTGESRLALKQVIESIIDHPESNLYTFTEDIMTNLFKQYSNTLKYLKTGKLDRQLFRIYGVKRLSLLCIEITNQLHSNGSSVVSQILKQHLIDSIPDLNVQLSTTNLDFLCNELLRRMKGVGTTLKLQL